PVLRDDPAPAARVVRTAESVTGRARTVPSPSRARNLRRRYKRRDAPGATLGDIGAWRARLLARQGHHPWGGMARPEPLHPEPTVPSVTDSLDRMVGAAQNVLGDEAKLLRVEVTSALTSALRSAAMALGGTVFLSVGWIIALMAVFQLLVPRLGTLGTLAVLIAANVLPGIGLVLGSWRGAKEPGRGER